MTVLASDKPGKLFRPIRLVLGRLEKVCRFFACLPAYAKSPRYPADLIARNSVFCAAAPGAKATSGERPAPTLAADLTNLQQELRELHQRVRTAAEQGRKEAGDGRDGSMVVRGK
jgi:hypothetical protein